MRKPLLLSKACLFCRCLFIYLFLILLSLLLFIISGQKNKILLVAMTVGGKMISLNCLNYKITKTAITHPLTLIVNLTRPVNHLAKKPLPIKPDSSEGLLIRYKE